MCSLNSTVTLTPPYRGRGRCEILDSAAPFVEESHFRDLAVGEVTKETKGQLPSPKPVLNQYFKELHDLIIPLLRGVEIVLHHTVSPWIEGESKPIAALREWFGGGVETCVKYGHIVSAIVEAAPLDERLEQEW